MLGNIYLHHVLDDWFEKTIKPLMRGRVFLVRYSDDFAIGFELETDARRVMAVLPKRFGRYGLTIHPDKTKLISFGRPDRKSGKGDDTFDFLGFTHFWARTRKGYWIIKRKTAGKRLRRTTKRIWRWCRDNRHAPITYQHKKLQQKLQGHYQYFGVRCNYSSMAVVYDSTTKAWKRWLNRRGGKGGKSWDSFAELTETFPLPKPRIVHQI